MSTTVAKHIPGADYHSSYTASCTCPFCNHERERVYNEHLAKSVAASVAPAEYRAPTARERTLHAYAERAITEIPDSECTDRGNYVVWNKFVPGCTLLLRSPDGIIDSHYPVGNRWNTSTEAELRELDMRAHAGKAVRVNGWCTDGKNLYRLLATDRQRVFIVYDYKQPDYSYQDDTYWTGSISHRDFTAASFAELPKKYLAAYRNWIAYRLHDAGRIHYARYETLVRVNQNPLSVGNVDRFGTNTSRRTYMRLRHACQAAGRLIATEVHDSQGNEDMIECLRNMQNTGSSIVEQLIHRIIDRWNEESIDGITYASCGHLCSSDDTHDTYDGDVCDDCNDTLYVDVENSAERRRRSSVYQHSDGCYYTYEEEVHDDEPDEDDESCGNRIKSYSTNVLNYYPADRKIVPSVWGEFLMGIELEVEPDSSSDRVNAADHTLDNLCDNYAILKNDGSLGDAGFEIVTAPRGLKEHIERFGKWKPHSSLSAWTTGNCGLHVHISSAAFNQSTLGKFIEFINHRDNDKLIKRIAGRTPTTDRGAQQYCQRDDQPALPNPKQTLRYKSSSRYHMVNTTNLSYAETRRLGLSESHANKNINTIELRIFKASLKRGRLLAQIEFAHAAVMFCRWTSMRELRESHFIDWLRKSAGMYPNLAKWFGVRSNTTTVFAEPEVVTADEV